MKKIFLSIVIITVFVFFGQAQKKKTNLDFLKNYKGKYLFDIKNTSALDTRIKAIMGDKYDQYLSAMDVQSPIKIERNIFSCEAFTNRLEEMEVTLVVDLLSNLIYVRLNIDEEDYYFKEKKGKTPTKISRVLKKN